MASLQNMVGRRRRRRSSDTASEIATSAGDVADVAEALAGLEAEVAPEGPGNDLPNAECMSSSDTAALFGGSDASSDAGTDALFGVSANVSARVAEIARPVRSLAEMGGRRRRRLADDCKAPVSCLADPVDATISAIGPSGARRKERRRARAQLLGTQTRSKSSRERRPQRHR